MNTAREQHTSSLLPNGSVLISGGYNTAYPSNAELYNPTTGTWTNTGDMNIRGNFTQQPYYLMGKCWLAVDIMVTLKVLLNYIILQQEIGLILAI